MEGCSYGYGPVPDRDASADRAADQGVGGSPRRECGLALQAPASLPPRRPRRFGARSRRPHRSPTRIADVYEDEIIAVHKALADDGLDAGAATIHYHLAQRYAAPPSMSTIFRVLKARGFVALSPQKRPKSSFKRFVADLPNETLAGRHDPRRVRGRHIYEVLNMIDDHSRLCVASRAMKVVKANDVVRVLHKAAETRGIRLRSSATTG